MNSSTKACTKCGEPAFRAPYRSAFIVDIATAIEFDDGDVRVLGDGDVRTRAVLCMECGPKGTTVVELMESGQACGRERRAG